ncbi:hypothetical protein L209DRAFT_756294 [Thermothelomyces heterothallicus CBS 203.75]
MLNRTERERRGPAMISSYLEGTEFLRRSDATWARQGRLARLRKGETCCRGKGPGSVGSRTPWAAISGSTLPVWTVNFTK